MSVPHLAQMMPISLHFQDLTGHMWSVCGSNLVFSATSQLKVLTFRVWLTSFGAMSVPHLAYNSAQIMHFHKRTKEKCQSSIFEFWQAIYRSYYKNHYIIIWFVPNLICLSRSQPKVLAIKKIFLFYICFIAYINHFNIFDNFLVWLFNEQYLI